MAEHLSELYVWWKAYSELALPATKSCMIITIELVVVAAAAAAAAAAAVVVVGETAVTINRTTIITII